jgi:hypothetical protein
MTTAMLVHWLAHVGMLALADLGTGLVVAAIWAWVISEPEGAPQPRAKAQVLDPEPEAGGRAAGKHQRTTSKNIKNKPRKLRTAFTRFLQVERART